MAGGAPAAPSASLDTPAALAKAALRRLALERREPTPENFAQAYAQESGAAAPTPAAAAASPSPAIDGGALADLVGQIVQGLDQGGKTWTRARKRDSLQRVLAGSRADAARLQSRLTQLVASWRDDRPDGVAAEAGPLERVEPANPVGPADPGGADAGPGAGLVAPAVAGRLDEGSRPEPRATVRLGRSLVDALRGASPGAAAGPSDAAAEASTEASTAAASTDPSADPLARALADCIDRLTQLAPAAASMVEPAPTPEGLDELDALCGRADRRLAHRERLIEQLRQLVDELTASLGVLAEDDGWARGQIQAMRHLLDEGLSVRGARSMSLLLHDTRERQQSLRGERTRARDAIKLMIQRMLGELGELGRATGRFHENAERYADVIERAETLEGLAGVVREMVEDSRTVAGIVSQAQSRLDEEHARARALTERVEQLEGELQRLSNEVATDPLTQVANRRGLEAAFEQALADRRAQPAPLSVGLLDIDNFKRLNDELGHAAGDVALKSLAQAVSARLRPADRIARFGGEEFVVLLPATPVEEAQGVLTRLQRSLSGSLFLHEQRPVFVTFSAGVTEHRPGESLDTALERADIALYEAKRTGKNRTCTG